MHIICEISKSNCVMKHCRNNGIFAADGLIDQEGLASNDLGKYSPDYIPVMPKWV